MKSKSEQRKIWLRVNMQVCQGNYTYNICRTAFKKKKRKVFRWTEISLTGCICTSFSLFSNLFRFGEFLILFIYLFISLFIFFGNAKPGLLPTALERLTHVFKAVKVSNHISFCTFMNMLLVTWLLFYFTLANS